MLKPLYLLLSCAVYCWVWTACTPTSDSDNMHGLDTDSTETRNTSPPKQLNSVKAAFLQLSKHELQLESIVNLHKADKLNLIQSGGSPSYKVQIEDRYLLIQEQGIHQEDLQEPLEILELVLYNPPKQPAIVLVSQAHWYPLRNKKQVIQQQFLRYQQQQWHPLNDILTQIKTKDFIESHETSLQALSAQYYLEINPADLNYLQAVLIHEDYPDKGAIVAAEAYKVALVWTGSTFRLDQQTLIPGAWSQYQQAQD